jgi:predicted metal-dependent hydrolase
MRVRDGGISLTAPPGIAQAEAEDFISKHFDWVEEQLKDEEEALLFLAGEEAAPSVWYKGVLTPVILWRDFHHTGKTSIRHTQDHIMIKMAYHSSSRLRPATLVEDWLKKQARAEIRNSLDEVLPMIGEAPVPVTIRDQKSRWGSCSTTRRLSFNWRLIMAPPEALHYVVVHEAAHLIHHDHSERFWGLVEDLMPDYAVHQDWLKKNQQALFTGIDRRLADLS